MCEMADEGVGVVDIAPRRHALGVDGVDAIVLDRHHGLARFGQLPTVVIDIDAPVAVIGGAGQSGARPRARQRRGQQKETARTQDISRARTELPWTGGHERIAFSVARFAAACKAPKVCSGEEFCVSSRKMSRRLQRLAQLARARRCRRRRNRARRPRAIAPPSRRGVRRHRDAPGRGERPGGVQSPFAIERRPRSTTRRVSRRWPRRPGASAAASADPSLPSASTPPASKKFLAKAARAVKAATGPRLARKTLGARARLRPGRAGPRKARRRDGARAPFRSAAGAGGAGSSTVTCFSWMSGNSLAPVNGSLRRATFFARSLAALATSA